eukprot:gene65875-biopygen48290
MDAAKTYTFSPIPTGHAGFHAVGYFRRDGSTHPAMHGNIAQIEWRRLAERDGHEIVESICAFAQPAGTTLRRVYEKLRDDLLDDLRAAMPVDVVLMKMHGAIEVEGLDAHPNAAGVAAALTCGRDQASEANRQSVGADPHESRVAK